MDSNSVILILNFILQVLQMADHSIFKRITSSKCICGEIQLDKYKDDKKDDKPKDDPINKL